MIPAPPHPRLDRPSLAEASSSQIPPAEANAPAAEEAAPQPQNRARAGAALASLARARRIGLLQ
jgi:hypothetical protein